MNSLLILRTLKAALKKQKITYKKLGQRLGLTEAAIKKQFQASDISFNRLSKICEVLGVSVDSVIDAAKSRPIRELKPNPKQQMLFLKNPELFVFFLRLSEENGDVQKANADFRIEKDRLWKYLKALDDVDLIRLHEGNRVELIHGRLLNIATEGILKSQITYKLAHTFLDKLQSSSSGDDFKEIKISLLRLPPQNAERLKEDLRTLYRTHLRQSEIDTAFSPSVDVSRYSLMLALGEFSFV